MMRIVAAAINMDGITLTAPPPARHHTIMNGASRLGFTKMFQPIHQGFLTDEGEFVSRTDALMIAEAASQPFKRPRDKYSSNELFSEDLW